MRLRLDLELYGFGIGLNGFDFILIMKFWFGGGWVVGWLK